MDRRASSNLVQAQVTQRRRFCLDLGRQKTASLATRCSANFKNVRIISVELKRKGQVYERPPIVREAQLFVTNSIVQEFRTIDMERAARDSVLVFPSMSTLVRSTDRKRIVVADCGTHQQWSLPVEANGHAIEVTGFGVK
jgi:hypothetical protein